MKDKTLKDDKLKPLLPTLRTKKRFVKISIESKHSFDFKELSELLTEEVLLLMGTIDMGKSGFWLLRDHFDKKNQTFICKISISYLEKYMGALCLVNKLGNHHVALRIKTISGTLKGVTNK